MDVKESMQAMDFFHGLNDNKYAVVKTSMLNGLAAKSIMPSSTPNEVYRLAGSWIKQPTHIEGGGYAEDAKKTRKMKQKKQENENPKKPKKKEEQKPRRNPRTYHISNASDARNIGIIHLPRNAKCIKVRVSWMMGS